MLNTLLRIFIFLISLVLKNIKLSSFLIFTLDFFPLLSQERPFKRSKGLEWVFHSFKNVSVVFCLFVVVVVVVVVCLFVFNAP